jgi:hypothetical protein
MSRTPSSTARHGGKVRRPACRRPAPRRACKGLRLGRRVQRGVGKQLVGQRLDAKLARNLALGAALLLEGQVQVFQLLLGGRGGNGGAQRVGELALLVNALSTAARRSSSSRR